VEHFNHTTWIEAAIRAPSSHNTQPWKFRALEDGAEILADRTRALPVNDPFDRELTISCGAALFNLRIAVASVGRDSEVKLLPDTGDPDRLAAVRLRDGPADPDLARLRGAIDERHSTRSAFRNAPLPEGLAGEVDAAARSEGARLRLVEGDVRATAASLVSEGDRLQFGDPRWRRELASWMRPRRSGDGLTTPLLTGPVSRFVVRGFDVGGRVARGDAELARGAPLLGVLATDDDEPRAWLRAGQALQRVLLTAAARDVQAGFLNQPCQVAALRPRLADAVSPGEVPQIVVRLGVPKAPLRDAPRRPIADVLVPAPRI